MSYPEEVYIQEKMIRMIENLSVEHYSEDYDGRDKGISGADYRSCLYSSTLQAEAVGGRSICRETFAILKVKLYVGSR